jgi:hypothetical protein
LVIYKDYTGMQDQQNIKKKRIPSIFTDESTGSCICLRSLIYMSHVNKVQPIRVKMLRIAAIRVNFCLLLLSNDINVGIGHTCNTMRVYHDTITWATADSFCSLFPTPSPHLALPHMWLRNAYDGQWLRCDVTKSAVWLARFQGHTKKASGKTYTCQNAKVLSTSWSIHRNDPWKSSHRPRWAHIMPRF